jgi:hypothetical protein
MLINNSFLFVATTTEEECLPSSWTLSVASGGCFPYGFPAASTVCTDERSSSSDTSISESDSSESVGGVSESSSSFGLDCVDGIAKVGGPTQWQMLIDDTSMFEVGDSVQVLVTEGPCAGTYDGVISFIVPDTYVLVNDTSPSHFCASDSEWAGSLCFVEEISSEGHSESSSQSSESEGNESSSTSSVTQESESQSSVSQSVSSESAFAEGPFTIWLVGFRPDTCDFSDKSNSWPVQSSLPCADENGDSLLGAPIGGSLRPANTWILDNWHGTAGGAGNTVEQWNIFYIGNCYDPSPALESQGFYAALVSECNDCGGYERTPTFVQSWGPYKPPSSNHWDTKAEAIDAVNELLDGYLGSSCAGQDVSAIEVSRSVVAKERIYGNDNESFVYGYACYEC